MTLSLPATAYVGLAVTSHKDGVLAAGTFTDVELIRRRSAAAPQGIGVEDAFPGAPVLHPADQAPAGARRPVPLVRPGEDRPGEGLRRQTPPQPSAPGSISAAKVNTSSEGGLLGLAFHPLYPARREVFVAYTTGSPMQLVVSRLILDNVDDAGRCDRAGAAHDQQALRQPQRRRPGIRCRRLPVYLGR